VSWLAASLLALAVALAAGFAWYERSKPSARLLAVVATLAALAILGRIAFAPLPNVKPTTDIVFIAGYALGGAPGFAVGAVAALGSNLFFGQGPWTPWQMGAWGLVGLFGAALAAVSGGRLGRMPLALACGVAGLVYGVILDFSNWVTFSGDHTLAKYIAYSGTSLPFNLAHAVGNVVFFLAFGPGLVRAVRRCRTRFDVVWRPAGAAVSAVLAALLVAGSVATPARSAGDRAARALAYLKSARNPDGGWGAAPHTSSDGLHTAWVVYALAASGVRPDATTPPTSALLVTRLARSHALDDIERTILGLRASGGDPRLAGGRDLVAELRAKQARDGSFGGYVSFTSYAILALRAVGETRGVPAAARWIARQANRDGGFNVYRRGGPSNPDDTAGAIEALVAAGRRSTPTVRHAVAFLRRAQLRNGGYSPLDYLSALQAPDGSVRYSSTSRQTPVWVTAQALLAFREKPLPVIAPKTEIRRAKTNARGGSGRPRVRRPLSATHRLRPRVPASRRRRGGPPDAGTLRSRTTPARTLEPRARAAGSLLAVFFEGLLRS
jgi:energy-coupling factor transport system substrate-specific component